MNRMTQKFFAFNHGELCPFCLSEHMETMEDMTHFLYVGRKCLDCGKEFWEKHKIVGYKEIKSKEEAL